VKSRFAGGYKLSSMPEVAAIVRYSGIPEGQLGSSVSEMVNCAGGVPSWMGIWWPLHTSASHSCFSLMLVVSEHLAVHLASAVNMWLQPSKKNGLFVVSLAIGGD
jgi:hypothetical protein